MPDSMRAVSARDARFSPPNWAHKSNGLPIETIWRGRRAFSIENDLLRVTVVAGGGHIAEIYHKPTNVSPLWAPLWPSMDPSDWDAQRSPEYGNHIESKLLASVLGHFLCLDLFGVPSPEEQAAGITLHGETPLAVHRVTGTATELTSACELQGAQLRVERRLVLSPSAPVFTITEKVENLSTLDRPVAWTQHVTLGAPFLERGVTQFRIPHVRSMSLAGVECRAEPVFQLTSAERSSGFVTHLLDPAREQVFFSAFSPKSRVLFGYIWKRSDFPWIGVWEENHHRQHLPWRGRELALGMEFGVSPFPESRRRMIERRELFGTPCYRWIPAKSTVSVEYGAFLTEAKALPSDITWDGHHTVNTT